jgi:hypothetical protein
MDHVPVVATARPDGHQIAGDDASHAPVSTVDHARHDQMDEQPTSEPVLFASGKAPSGRELSRVACLADIH